MRKRLHTWKLSICAETVARFSTFSSVNACINKQHMLVTTALMRVLLEKHQVEFDTNMIVRCCQPKKVAQAAHEASEEAVEVLCSNSLAVQCVHEMAIRLLGRPRSILLP